MEGEELRPVEGKASGGPPTIPRSRAPWASLLLLLGACGPVPGSETRPILLLERPPPLPSTTLDPEEWSRQLGAQVTLEGGAVHLEWTLEPEGWTALERGVLRRSHPLPQQFRGIASARPELRSQARTYASIREFDERTEARGCYYSTKDNLYFRPLEGEQLSEMSFSMRLPRYIETQPGQSRFSTGSLSGAGALVLPGESWTCPVRVAPGRTLRFFATVRAKSEDPRDRVRFEVASKGVPLWSHDRSLDPLEDAWHEVPLSNLDFSGDVELSFSVHGAPAWTAFVSPTLGPAEPAPPAQPNLVLFLADTFRADNLALYGGDATVTPELNRLAGEGVAFENAWSTSCWTLPSQGSMFTGLLPPDHGAQLESQALSHEIPTLTDVLRAAGYRTGAITDGGFVSSSFNFDQGFEWYVEQPNLKSWSLDRTLQLASEFLRARDGRPTFLFVQTYRTHYPYRVGPEESRAEADTFLREMGEEPNLGMGALVQTEAAVRGLRPFYLAAASDLDAKVGRWWQDFEEFLSPHGYMLFTSDHGEAFYEHENHDHRGWMWNELLRVPMFLLGPDLDGRVEDKSASLIDVPRTLVGLAGVQAHPSWQGVDLLDLQEQRRMLGFYRDARRYDYAAFDHGHKILGVMEDADRPRYAYDLASDPEERHNLAGQVDWAAEFLRDVAPFIGREEPPASTAELAPETIEGLRAIGYGGD